MRARPEAESVDLLPLLNVVVLLIPFTLLGASFVEIREVGVFAPAEGPGVDGSDPLVVDVFADRLVVHSGGGAEQVACGGTCEPGGRWTSQLAALLRSAKAERGPESLVVRPGDDVHLAVAVAVLDAARADTLGELYPDVSFAGPPGG